jgi:hypothetical protein
MVDEARMLPLAVQALTSAHSIPLCLDSSDISAIRAGLEAYPGSPLVNSISGEEERMDILGPCAATTAPRSSSCPSRDASCPSPPSSGWPSSRSCCARPRICASRAGSSWSTPWP